MNAYEENFGMKNLNSVTIRAYSDMTIGNRKYKAGEPVLWLDKVQIAQLNENKRFVAARGGWKNLARVVWTDFYDLQFRFTNGLVSKTSMGFFTESGAIEKSDENPIRVNKKETVEVVGGIAKLLHNPLNEKLFIYSLDKNGDIIEKIEDYSILNNSIQVGNDVNSILVDYYYNYNKQYTNYKVTDKEMDGCFTIEGYADIKSEETGILQTYFFEMPKAKITSNLEMNLGEKANPTLSVFEAIGLPVERDGETVICSMYLLEDDIMSDF